MPTESAFLFAGLLFIAAALGYVFAKFADPDEEEQGAAQLSVDYVKGLNFLLNEQSDQAVEVFTRMAEFDDDALETHLALGSLFRKRGEIDRAIKVHQNLLARPGLARRQKDQARLELAEDYLSAGLLDRAESLFMELRESPEYCWQALSRLTRIFEMTQEWQQAIESHEALERLNGAPDESNPLPHYYCELAEQARRSKDYTRAREMLKAAEADRRTLTVRSRLIRAHIAQDLGDHSTALKIYEQAAADAPSLLVDIIPRHAASCRESGEEQRQSRFLKAAAKTGNEAIAAIAMAAILDERLDDPVAQDALQSFLSAHPTLDALVEGERLAQLDHGERNRQLARIRSALRSLLVGSHRYRCRDCGYATLILQWQCPSCRAWETVKPETGISLSASL